MLDFFSYNCQPLADRFFVRCVVDTDAFVFVLPLLLESWEEIVAGNNQDPPFLEPFIKFGVCYGQLREP